MHDCLDGLKREFENMGLNIPAPDIKIFGEQMNATRYIAGIEQYLRDHEPVEIALIIFSDFKSTRLSQAYDGLKKMASCQLNIPIQCAKANTIRKGQSVWNKIATQMVAKVGGVPWVVDRNYSSLGLHEFTAVVGIDVCHSGNKSVVGFTMSINPTLSRYFNTIRIAKNANEELIA